MLRPSQSGIAKRVSPVLTLVLGAVSALSICGSCLAADAGARTAPAAATDSGPAAAASTLDWTLWLVGGSVACALVLGGLWFYVRANRRQARPGHKPERTSHARSTPPRNVARAPRPATRPLAAVFTPKAEGPRKPLNGKPPGHNRRKMFDYNRYYIDLMGAVSANNAQVETPPLEETPLEPLPAPSAVPPGNEPAAPAAPALTQEQQAELLASQRELMEEQKRLIQEQNRLLEEKNQLLAKKNEFLRLQLQTMEKKAA